MSVVEDEVCREILSTWGLGPPAAQLPFLAALSQSSVVAVRRVLRLHSGSRCVLLDEVPRPSRSFRHFAESVLLDIIACPQVKEVHQLYDPTRSASSPYGYASTVGSSDPDDETGGSNISGPRPEYQPSHHTKTQGTQQHERKEQQPSAPAQPVSTNPSQRGLPPQSDASPTPPSAFAAALFSPAGTVPRPVAPSAASHSSENGADTVSPSAGTADLTGGPA